MVDFYHALYDWLITGKVEQIPPMGNLVRIVLFLRLVLVSHEDEPKKRENVTGTN